MDAFDDDAPVGSDDEPESMTAAEVLKSLEEAWLNEKFSPELLENKSELVDCMLEQLSQMEDNIQRANKADFKVSIHRLEVDRIRYIISSYLRIRLKKIEKYTEYVLESEAKSDNSKMSPQELQFAKEYQANMEAHFTNVALRQMPPNVQKLDPKQTMIHPNLDRYIFLKVKESVEGVLVEEETAEAREEVIDLEKGDQHLIRYKPISSLVADGSVTLI